MFSTDTKILFNISGVTYVILMLHVQSPKYLGITITDNMDWGQHVSEISSKATTTLGFLRRNLAFEGSCIQNFVSA